MIPDPSTHNKTPEYVADLLARIGRSQTWIAENVGISRRRLQYLLIGTREIVVDGVQKTKPVELTYPEQFALECLAAAGERFPKKRAKVQP